MLKEFYKYFYAAKGRYTGKATVISCTLYHSEIGIYSRGVAVCNISEDEPDVMRGKFHAKNYALRALKGRVDTEYIIRKEAIRTIINSGCPFVCKSEKYPRLTFEERKYFKVPDTIVDSMVANVKMTHFDIKDGFFLQRENIKEAQFYAPEYGSPIEFKFKYFPSNRDEIAKLQDFLK